MITAKKLIAYAEAALGCEYWYGTFGNRSSESLLKSKRAQYPSYYIRENYNRGWTVNGKRVFDCVGLIKGAIWSAGNFYTDPVYNSSQDVSANGMLSKCNPRGKIKTIPEVPGVLVFLTGHVGVYIGNGEVIEARGHNYGVVKTKLKDRPWTDWGYCPWIDYTEVTKPVVKEESKPATSTSTKTTVQVEYTHTVKSALNVRTGPGTKYGYVPYSKYPAYIREQLKKDTGSLPAGTKVSVIKTQGTWAMLGADVWVSANYLTKIASPYTHKIIGAVNVRTGPGTNYKAVDCLQPGEKVKVSKTQSGWYCIGDIRWIAGNYAAKI